MLQNYYNDSKHIPCNTFVISITLICIMCLPNLHHVFYEDKRITSTPRTDSHHRHAGATHQRQRHRAPHSAADRRTLYDLKPVCPCHRDRRWNRCRYFSPAGPNHGHRHGFTRHQVQRKDESQSCRRRRQKYPSPTTPLP